ncbi:MAG TPA: aminotransferase class III-fold pyridoxal phosphate-dependent enzyme [Streptosporangiaceae bacterium]|jgi:adenosylmethionine-8-amino-7-oxononanoate aminotransferase
MRGFLRDDLSRDQFLVEGRGIYVRDHGGKWYADARSSLWNVALGYGHPRVTAAIRRQLDLLPFATLLSYSHPAAVTVEFANALAARLPGRLRHIRLGSTGSQMTEAAMLLSRFFRQATGEPERIAVIAVEGSYHGTGPGASALSGCLLPVRGWNGPVLPGVHHVPAGGPWAAAVRELAGDLGEDRVTAVIIEPMMGSTGVIPADDDLRELAGYCRARGIHLIGDEVTTGYGRTGHLSRLLHLGIEPDLLIFSKAITAGYVPGAALAVHDEIFDPVFLLDTGQAFVHGSTTDGHPLAAAAGLAVLAALYEDGVMAAVPAAGELLQDALAALHREYLPAGEVGGAGLMRRFQLRGPDGSPWPMAEVMRLHGQCEENGLLVSAGAGCLWFLPPLVISDGQITEVADRFGDALAGLRKAGSAYLT